MNIRNFVIIAHIDHGKSTLADRLLELTATIEKRKMRSQFLDTMDLERERGITIKMQPVRMIWKPNHSEIRNPKSKTSFEFRDSNFEFSNSEYILNLIDTPGHIDFGYEVSRALMAVEGAILLIDATKGIQAQTLANFDLARKAELIIIPVINKIDMPEARVSKTRAEVADMIGCAEDSILCVSAKTGEGVEKILERVVALVPPPEKNKKTRAQTAALIFDSHYSPHKGAVAYVRMFGGSITPNEEYRLVHKAKPFSPMEVGIFSPSLISQPMLVGGEIGYIATNVKDPSLVRVGDTIVDAERGRESIGTYKEPAPMVWASIFPKEADDFSKLQEAFSKLSLNDAALSMEIESSLFGRALRAGFLGMLHLEITVERLRREFDCDVAVAIPSVEYSIVLRTGEQKVVRTHADFDPAHIVEAREPWFMVSIVGRTRDMGAIIELTQATGGEVHETKNVGDERIMMRVVMPLRKVVSGFFDDLKSATQGYGSMSYEFFEMRSIDLVKLSVFVAEREVPQFARLLPRHEAEREARRTVERLFEMLPNQLFPVKIQAGMGGKIMASRTLPAVGKNVTAKLYGGDRSRKMKLWKKQKEGKRRLTEHARVDIPHDVYLKMISKN